MNKQQSIRAQGSVDNWNKRHPVGCPVMVRKDDGSFVNTHTRSLAWVLSGHTAVIQLEGISGCYALDRVFAEA